MSLRHALLGALSTGRRSGYELVRRFDDTLNLGWTASQGSIYPELVRLEREGLIRMAESGARGRKTYELTEPGAAALRQWLLSPFVPEAKDELMLRAFTSDQLTDGEAIACFERLREQHTARQGRYEEVLAATGSSSRREMFNVIALRAAIAREAAMAAWADSAVAEVRSERHDGEGA